jgi:energy-converting hydrogenase A subunit M
VREMIDNGFIEIVFVPTDENIADIFTKKLDSKKFKNFQTKFERASERLINRKDIKNKFFARAIFSNLKVLNALIVEKSLNNVFQGICVYHQSISTFLGNLDVDVNNSQKRKKSEKEYT